MATIQTIDKHQRVFYTDQFMVTHFATIAEGLVRKDKIVLLKQQTEKLD